MRHLSRTAAAVGGAIIMTLGSVSAVHASQTSGDRVTAAPTQAGTHCVVTAQGNTPNPAVTTACFDTFAESISYATGGKVKLAPGQRTLDEAPLVAATTVVGIEYEDSNFGGASIAFQESSSGFTCGGGRYVNFPSMPSGWDNKISSARSYSGCKSGHSEYTSNGGSLKICGCATMGTMSDKTSSIRYSASGI